MIVAVNAIYTHLVEHCTGKSPGHGFKPDSSPEFFSGFFTQLHKLRSLRRSFLHFPNIFCRDVNERPRHYVSQCETLHAFSLQNSVVSKFSRATGRYPMVEKICFFFNFQWAVGLGPKLYQSRKVQQRSHSIHVESFSSNVFIRLTALGAY